MAALVALALAAAACGGSGTKAPARTRTATSTVTGAAGTPRTGMITVTTPQSQNVRLPATFTIAPGGALSPPTVSGPGGVPIQLTVVSHDRRPHEVTLRASPPRRLAVAADRATTLLIVGLRNGSYAIEVDGVKRAKLIVGVAPGP